MKRNPRSPRIYTDYATDFGSITTRLHRLTFQLLLELRASVTSEH